MGKKPKSRATIRTKFAKTRPSNYWMRSGDGDSRGELDTMEQTAAVCELLCEGWPVSEVLKYMKESYGAAGKMTREHAYDLLHHAGDQGWLEFRAPEHYEFTEFLRRQYPSLAGVNVVHSSTLRDVAKRAAHVVLSLLMQHRDRDKVHVGLAGGISVRSVASALAKALCGPMTAEELPREVVFHSLISGFDLHDPTTDPTTFFTFFVEEPALKITPRFVGLVVPAIVQETDIKHLRKMDGIREAIEEAKELDIVVTSGSDWSDDHSLLRRAMKSEESIAKLEADGCVGDLLCRPLGAGRPITTQAGTRAFTVIELEDLSKMVEGGKHVVLMLGPCAGCGEPKGNLLRTVLEQDRPLVSHVVTDTRSAGEVYAYLKKEGAGDAASDW